jgi:hypothetical protein
VNFRLELENGTYYTPFSPVADLGKRSYLRRSAGLPPAEAARSTIMNALAMLAKKAWMLPPRNYPAYERMGGGASDSGLQRDSDGAGMQRGCADAAHHHAARTGVFVRWNCSVCSPGTWPVKKKRSQRRTNEYALNS